jgi:hypothetical protein
VISTPCLVNLAMHLLQIRTQALRSINVGEFSAAKAIHSIRGERFSPHDAQFVLHAQDQAEVAMGGNLDKEKPRQSSSEGKLTIRGIDGTPFR